MKHSCITVGTFDGVHLGHRKIITTTLKIAEALDYVPLIVTLSYLLKHNNSNEERWSITTEDEKMSILREMGAKNIEVIEFNHEIEEMTAPQFIEFLKEQFQLKHLVAGYNHTFGKEREGDVKYLAGAIDTLDIAVTLIPPYRVGNNIVSSTLIRNLIVSGDVKSASQCLGRFYTISGIVDKGVGIARDLGFRTINLKIPEKKLIPANGVYAVLVYIRGKTFPGACYIGESQTLKLSRKSVEVHIIDFEGDIYGDIAMISFVDFLREDICFPSVDELKKQISSDILRAKKLIAEFL